MRLLLRSGMKMAGATGSQTSVPSFEKWQANMAIYQYTMYMFRYVYIYFLNIFSIPHNTDGLIYFAVNERLIGV